MVESASICVSAQALTEDILQTAEIISESCQRYGGKPITFRNRGNRCDVHIAAESAGRLISDRAPPPVLVLRANSSAVIAIANDCALQDISVRDVTGKE